MSAPSRRFLIAVATAAIMVALGFALGRFGGLSGPCRGGRRHRRAVAQPAHRLLRADQLRPGRAAWSGRLRGRKLRQHRVGRPLGFARRWRHHGGRERIDRPPGPAPARPLLCHRDARGSGDPGIRVQNGRAVNRRRLGAGDPDAHRPRCPDRLGPGLCRPLGSDHAAALARGHAPDADESRPRLPRRPRERDRRQGHGHRRRADEGLGVHHQRLHRRDRRRADRLRGPAGQPRGVSRSISRRTTSP